MTELRFGAERDERLEALHVGAAVVEDHARALAHQQARGCDAALAEPDDQNALTLQIHVQRSFNVASVATANMMERIQNRTITFGSGQPFFSKWW